MLEKSKGKGGIVIKNCPKCSGKLKKEKINYKTYIDNQEYIIQDIWANSCEYCDETYFDTKIAIEIEETIESIKRETSYETIDLFLKILANYWKDNKKLSFNDIVERLDKKYNLHKLDLGAKDLTLILDKIILETFYTDLREKISRVYSKELEKLEEEKDKRNLTTTILKWSLSGKAYIETAGMRFMVDGYIEGYNKTRNIKKGGI